MDDPDCDPEELRVALRELSRVNRLFGGLASVRAEVDALLDGVEPDGLDILDVGSGAGDIPIALAEHLSRRGWSPRLVITDLHMETVKIARETVAGSPPRVVGRSVRFARADGARLPFPADAFDLVLSSSTLHHLEEHEAIRLFVELDRVARLGWVVTDLRRSRVAQVAVSTLVATAWRGKRFPRRDGPVSVRRAFTPSEVRGLVERAGCEDAVVRSGVVRLAARGGGHR